MTPAGETGPREKDERTNRPRQMDFTGREPSAEYLQSTVIHMCIRITDYHSSNEDYLARVIH